MVTLEVHPEIHIREQLERPGYSTCHECRRTFHAKSEDQFSLTLCDVCFEDLRSLREPIISIHVKPRPRCVTDNADDFHGTDGEKRRVPVGGRRFVT